VGGHLPGSVGGRPVQDHLLDHTLLRPRDVIQLANRCRDTAEQNGHLRVTRSDLDEALLQFSTWKLQDLLLRSTLHKRLERGGRVERKDTTFYLHPCVRPALRAREPTGVFDHDDYDYLADQAVGQTTASFLNEGAIRPARDGRGGARAPGAGVHPGAGAAAARARPDRGRPAAPFQRRAAGG
jgi:hypothetical protein